MNWDALGAIGELVGAAAVVISIIYLAIQIRQNTESNKTLTTQNLVNQNSDLVASYGGDPVRCALMQKGMLEGFAGLTPEERFRFNCNMLAIYNQFELAFHQHEAGNLQTIIWQKFAYEIPIWISTPGGKAWYEQDKGRYSAEFNAYISKSLESYTPAATLPTVGYESAPET